MRRPWWQHTFCRSLIDTWNGRIHLCAGFLQASGFQKKLTRILRARAPPISPIRCLHARVVRWVPGASVAQVSAAVQVVRKVCKESSLYLGLAVSRVLARGVCISARFHRGPEGCCWN
eukprot:5105890-Pyramimonas_sp.AAC.1